MPFFFEIFFCFFLKNGKRTHAFLKKDASFSSKGCVLFQERTYPFAGKDAPFF